MGAFLQEPATPSSMFLPKYGHIGENFWQDLMSRVLCRFALPCRVGRTCRHRVLSWPVKNKNWESPVAAEGNLASRLKFCATLIGGAEELSRKAGIPRRTLETYLSGMADPKGKRLAAICQTVGISGHWLLTGEGQRFISGEDGILPLLRSRPELDSSDSCPMLINAGALAVIVEYVWRLGPDKAIKERCQLAAQQYSQMAQEGFITPDSCGTVREGG